jgi:hypothetical protein
MNLKAIEQDGEPRVTHISTPPHIRVVPNSELVTIDEFRRHAQSARYVDLSNSRAGEG